MSKKAIGSAKEEKLQIEDAPDLDLSVNDLTVFVEALTDPRPVSDRLRETVRRYRQATGI